GPLDFQLAGGGGSDQLDRVLVIELEVDEIARIENFQRQLLRLRRRLERKREMQGQRGILVFKEVVDRLLEFFLFSVGLCVVEIGKFLERFDIGLRQRAKFLAAV